MRKKQTKKIIVGIIFAILCVGLIFGLLVKPRHKAGETAQVPEESSVETKNVIATTPSENKVSFEEEISTTSIPFSKRATFKVGGEDFVIQVSDHTTVYDAMNSLMSEGKMTFEGKDYPALGFFVTQINSLEAGDGKNLMYYINGEEASVGVSAYVVKEGDIIEWKLK